MIPHHHESAARQSWYIDTHPTAATHELWRSCRCAITPHVAPLALRSNSEVLAVATQTIDIKVASNGRMVLPASVRKAMGLHGDAKVILTVEDDQVRLSPIGHGVSRAQALYREHAKQARTTDDFLDDRRVEAAIEHDEAASGGEDRGVQ